MRSSEGATRQAAIMLARRGALADTISPLGALAALVSRSPFPLSNSSDEQKRHDQRRSLRNVMIPQRARSALPQARLPALPSRHAELSLAHRADSRQPHPNAATCVVSCSRAGA